MKLKLDENLGQRGQSILEAAGHDVSTVPHQQLGGANDDDLMEQCRRDGRGLVSLDLEHLSRTRNRMITMRFLPITDFKNN
jgi:predicted nuclease of predicted toxin-antitoxin system